MERDDVVELVDHGTSIGLRMTLTPSGTERLTAPCLGDLADAGLRRMALSLDGAEASTHDAFRGETGSFASTMAAATYAHEVGLPLQINTTVCEQTVGELPAIRDRVADLGAVLWSIFFLVPVGRGAVLDSISPAHAEHVMHWLVDVAAAASFGVKTTEAPQYRRVRQQHARSERSRQSTATGPVTGGPSGETGDTRSTSPPGIGRRAGIVAGDGFAFVSHVGELFPSGFLPESVGRVPEGDIVDLYRSAPLFEALRDRASLERKCGACRYQGSVAAAALVPTRPPGTHWPAIHYVPTCRRGTMGRFRRASEDERHRGVAHFGTSGPPSRSVRTESASSE